MSTIAKIFAFIMLVSAVAVGIGAYSYMTHSESWMGKYNDLDKKTTKEINDLKAQVAAANTARDEAITAKTNAETERDNFKTKYGDYVAANDDLKNQLKEEKEKLAGIQAALDKQAGELTKLQNENNTLTSERDAAVKARLAAEKSQRDAEDKLAKCEDDLLNVRNQLKLTQGKLISAVDTIDRYKDVYGEQGERLTAKAELPVEKINGKIAAANNTVGLVKISVGKGDGVTKDMEFEVVRPDADAYIGRVKVTEVADEEAICRIDRRMTVNPIQEGDHVTTRLK